MGIAELYSKEIRANLKNFPVWEPGAATAPGDVGELVKGVFVRQTSLKEMGVSVSTKRLPVENSRRLYQSRGSFTSALSGSGGDAKLRLEFSKNGAVVFHAEPI